MTNFLSDEDTEHVVYEGPWGGDRRSCGILQQAEVPLSPERTDMIESDSYEITAFEDNEAYLDVSVESHPFSVASSPKSFVSLL